MSSFPGRAMCGAILGLTLAVTASALGQGHPGGGPPPGGGGQMPSSGPPGSGAPGGQMPPGSFGPPGTPPPSNPRDDGTTSTLRGGLQLGPPGRWWDDHSFAKGLGLRSDQKGRMDDIFNANKTAIFTSYQSLISAENDLEKFTKQSNPAEADVFAAIDRVAAARASLEKANAHMLLAIRHEMTDEQLKKLDSHR